MRKYYALLILVCGFAALGAIDGLLAEITRKQNEELLLQEKEFIGNRLRNSFSVRFNATSALATIFKVRPDTSPEEFAEYARAVLQSAPPIRALQYADPQTRVTFVHPPRGNEITLQKPMVLLEDPLRGPWTRRAIESRRYTVQDPFPLRQGGVGTAVRTPIFSGDEFRGLIIGVVDLDALVGEAVQGIDTDHFQIALTDSQDQLFWGEMPEGIDVEWSAIPVGDEQWHVIVAWRGTPPGKGRTARAMLWGLGGALVLALAWGMRSSLRSSDLLVARKERDLELSEERFAKAFMASPMLTAISTLEDGRLLEVNDTFLNALGLTRDEVVGQTSTELGFISAEQRELLKRKFVEEGRIDRVEMKIRRREGGSFWGEFSGELIEVDGRTCIFMLVQDVSRRREAERALKESEGRYRGLFENMIDVVHRTDQNGRIEVMSPSCESLFGYRPEEVVGREIRDFYADPARRDAFLAEVRASGRVKDFQVQIRHKDGSLVWVSTNARVLRDADGGFAGVEGVTRDITALKNAEEDRNQLLEQLRQTQKLEAIGTLAGGIAHDFNNILAAILGYSELLKLRLKDGSEDAKDIDQVITAAQRARDLVKQILTFSRKAEQSRRPVPMHQVVVEATRLLRQTIPATIDIQQDIAVEDDTVLADTTQLHQIVVNLATNAFHAMQDTGGVLRISMAPVEADAILCSQVPNLVAGPYVRLTVTDTGEGMAPETLAKVFEPFFTTKPQGQGTGMGMAVVHGIVRSHGGTISITSQPGQGTCVNVYLPRNPEAANTQGPAASPSSTGSERILVVDDEPALATMTGRMLSALGYFVVSLVSSREALERFLRDPHAFDLVITDQAMPGLSGATLSQEMLKVRPDLPIVICTGYSESMGEARAREIGVKALLEKPLDRALLAQTVREVLDGTPRRHEREASLS